MQEPGFPADEAYRLSTLQELNLLDTMAEERFDRLTRIAQRLFDVPIVLIVLIDKDRQWFKSAIGVDVSETPRSIALCAHTILQKSALVVNDTMKDSRFLDNPLVTGSPKMRFYAGKAVYAPNGEAVGTLCIADTKTRDFNTNDVELLTSLAELVEKEINHPDLQALDNHLNSDRDLSNSLEQLRRDEKHQRLRNEVLELISRGYPLHEVLNSVVSNIEVCNPDYRACIEIRSISGDKPQRYWGHHQDYVESFNQYGQRSQLIKDSKDEPLGQLLISAQKSSLEHSAKIRFLEEATILASIAVERDQADRLIWKQANYDSLTGLPNRNLLRERLGQELNKARRHQLKLALLFIDLDHFKQVNDTLGHQKGDELLAQVGSRLNQCMRDSDTIARLGGDEFTVIAVELNDKAAVEQIANKILQEISREFKLEQESIFLSASIGIAFYPDHGDDMDQLIRSADSAMYDAKNSGKNRFFYFSE